MGRAENKPILIPAGVSVEVRGISVSVSGPKGQMESTFTADVRFTLEGAQLALRGANGGRQARAMVGTAKSIIGNMIAGVTEGFSKRLEIAGVGFKAALKGAGVLDLSLGTSHPILYSIPTGVKVTVADGVKLTVEGIDRQKVGQVAADIRAFYPMEPYKGKGVCIVGQFVRRKEGKKTA
jgi:large subunit ribosomal protein L6